jgi:hypothetical protein
MLELPTTKLKAAGSGNLLIATHLRLVLALVLMMIPTTLTT